MLVRVDELVTGLLPQVGTEGAAVLRGHYFPCRRLDGKMLGAMASETLTQSRENILPSPIARSQPAGTRDRTPAREPANLQ